MNSIITGTTPIIRYIFKTIDPSNLDVAILKVSQSGEAVIVKNIDDGIIDNVTRSISWKLTQEETLGLNVKYMANVSLDWLLNDGTRGAGKTANLKVEPSATNEVIIYD